MRGVRMEGGGGGRLGAPCMQSPYTLYRLTCAMAAAARCSTPAHAGEGEGAAAVQLQVEAMAALVLLLMNAVCVR